MDTGAPVNDNLDAVEILLYLPLSAPDAGWKYVDNGSDPGLDWRMSTFDDQLWKMGSAYFGFGSQWQGLVDPGPRAEVEFGQDPINKYVTTYFRRSFSAPDLAELTNVVLRVTYTGGMIAYLNGLEILRSGMSTGAVDHLTLAANDGEPHVLSKRLDPGFFIGGENQLAVEVHLALPAQESMVFELRLMADLPSGPPRISLLDPQSSTIPDVL